MLTASVGVDACQDDALDASRLAMQVDEQPAAKAEAADMLDQRRTSHADASPSKAPDINGRASRPSSAGVKPEDSPERSDGTKATASATDADGAPSEW